MLNLSEIFFSIQGESTFAGLPCIFIRLAGCNLRCKYCDTKFSYDTKFSLESEEILQKIKKYYPVKLVEITGGEPLLQNEIYDLIKSLHKNNFKILLETNGSISMKQVPKYVIKIIDVKCPGSGYEDSFVEENLKYIDSKKDEMKFVLSDRNDFDWAKEFIKKFNLENHKIIFSAVFEKLDSKTLAQWILEDKLKVRMQLQMHKYIWGRDKRGV
ncbi:MAG: radical SAM protein [Armatimonadetes bacterium]|nr:radical SAM protein [Armatimonadota bacterium]